MSGRFYPAGFRTGGSTGCAIATASTRWRGTELALLLRGETSHGIAVYDTTQIHVEAAIDELLAT